MSWASIVFTFALVDNVVLSRLLGLAPEGMPGGAPGGAASASTPSAVWLGGSMTVLMSVSAVAARVLDSLILVPLGFTLLRTPVLVFLVAGVALGFQALAVRFLPLALERAGVSMPRLGVNCVVLGLVLITTRAEYGPLQGFLAGAAAGAGYLAVTAMMGAIRERLEIEPVPPALRGMPVQLITAGLMAYAFMAFDRGFLARLLGA
jgi:Na+-translocating ferredoxin:NAD+ oxidoreductase subunit A